MAENQDLDNLIELIDDDGNPVQFSHIMTFEHEGARYVALEPEETFREEEGEVVLLRIETEEDEDVFVTIDDEVEENGAFAAFLELYQQMFDEDEDDDNPDEPEEEDFLN